MRLETDRYGKPVLIVKLGRERFLQEAGWTWARANAVRYDLEKVLGEFVNISWDNE
jgi:hypothetical protein